ncbi:hypothetical protein MMC27_001522 [Xylographa pallens]|nr:hypothetical protein [Xylographa pallens]
MPWTTCTLACKHPIHSQPLDEHHRVACLLCTALSNGSPDFQARARAWVPYLHDSRRTPELSRQMDDERAAAKRHVEQAEVEDAARRG